MKFFKNKKNKIIFTSLCGIVTTTSIATPFIVKNANNDSYYFEQLGLKSINSKIALNINTLEQLNYIIDPNNSNDIINYLNENENIPSNIKIVALQFKLSSNTYQLAGSNVKVDYDISYDKLDDNESVIIQNVKNIDTGLQIINFSINDLRNKIKEINMNTINDLLSPNNIKSTIFDMNIGLNDQNTENITVVEAYNHDTNIQKMSIDMNITLKSSYVYNLSNNSNDIASFTNEISIKKIKTKFSNYRINKQNLIDAINKINSVSNLNSILYDYDNLSSFINDSNFVSDPELIVWSSAQIKELNSDGKIVIEVNSRLFNNEWITVDAITNIQAVCVNESIFKSNFRRNITRPEQLQENNSPEIINNTSSLFLANQSNLPSSNLVPLDAISNTSNFVYQNVVIENQSWLNNYNCEIILNDNYCFYNQSNNTINDRTSVNDVLSGIQINTNLEESFINDIKNNLYNMTIDNYTSYFNGADKYPDNKNSGRMEASKLFNLSNNKLNSTNCKSWKFRRSSDTSGPYLKLNLTLEFKEPYTYKGQTTYTFENIPTQTYDPDSKYNWNLFTWSGDDITGIKFNEYKDSIQYTNNIIYLPYATKNLNLSQTSDRGAIEPGQNGWSNDYRIEKLDATFAKQLIYLKGHRGFFRANIDHYDFSGLPNFIGSVYGGYRGKDSTYYFAESNTKTFNFNDCPKLEKLGTLGWFKSCPNTKIQWFSFNNCPRLHYLPQDLFNGYAAKNGGLHVDLRGTTNITSSDQSAFYAYGSANEVWVSNESSKSVIDRGAYNQGKVIVKSL